LGVAAGGVADLAGAAGDGGWHFFGDGGERRGFLTGEDYAGGDVERAEVGQPGLCRPPRRLPDVAGGAGRGAAAREDGERGRAAEPVGWS
jgi:hypothetical protein